MRTYLLTFIPIFVAVDVLGLLPVYASLTRNLSMPKKRRTLYQSVLTASAVGLVFMFLGKWLFMVLGITVSDFKVAGGLVLLVISLTDLLQSDKGRLRPSATMGVVPIGVPLIVGPGVLTTMVMLMDAFGIGPTIFSFILNMLIVLVIFLWAESVTKVLGVGGSNAVSKIASLLLAAIAVMMIRKGLVEIIRYSYHF